MLGRGSTHTGEMLHVCKVASITYTFIMPFFSLAFYGQTNYGCTDS